MNHLTLMIYIYGIIKNVKILIIMIGIASIILAFIPLWIADNEDREPTDGDQKWFVLLGSIGVLVLVSTIFIPSSKTFAEMVLLPKIIQNHRVQDITGKSGEAAELYLDKVIKQLKESK